MLHEWTGYSIISQGLLSLGLWGQEWAHWVHLESNGVSNA